MVTSVRSILVLPSQVSKEILGRETGDQTLFAGIRKLMPGHHLTLA
jgi:hypothetical protein